MKLLAKETDISVYLYSYFITYFRNLSLVPYFESLIIEKKNACQKKKVCRLLLTSCPQEWIDWLYSLEKGPQFEINKYGKVGFSIWKFNL